MSIECMCKQAAVRVVWGHASTENIDACSVFVFEANFETKQLLQ